MKTSKSNSAKKDKPMFAFLPEMVIEHINHPDPKEFKKNPYETKNDETSNATTTQPIVFEPLADPFEGLNIEIKSITKKGKKKVKKKNKIKCLETVLAPKIETTTTAIPGNKIIQFIKTVKINFFNF